MRVWGIKLIKFVLARNCTKCPHVHRHVMFANHHALAVGVRVKIKTTFAMNYLKCSDLDRKVKFANQYLPVGRASRYIFFSLGIETKVKFCKEKSFFIAFTPLGRGGWGQWELICKTKIFAWNLMKLNTPSEKCHINEPYTLICTERSCLPNPKPIGVGVNFKNVFARNFTKCYHIHRNVMFASHHPMAVGMRG